MALVGFSVAFAVLASFFAIDQLIFRDFPKAPWWRVFLWPDVYAIHYLLAAIAAVPLALFFPESRLFRAIKRYLTNSGERA